MSPLPVAFPGAPSWGALISEFSTNHEFVTYDLEEELRTGGNFEPVGCPGAILVVRNGPGLATIGPMVSVAFERIEALELLGMTLAHLNDAEARADLSPRIPLLMAIRDKLAAGLREES